MIIYEVNLDIKPDIVMEFNDWLDGHIEEMLEFEGFESARKLNTVEEDTHFLTVQYFIKSQEDLDRYLRNHAEKMREKGKNKFGDYFKAGRRILKTLKIFTRSGI